MAKLWHTSARPIAQERRPPVEKISAQARCNTERAHEISPFAAWLRDRILALLLPMIGERGQNWIYDYKAAW